MSLNGTKVATTEERLLKLGLGIGVEDDFLETSSKILNVIYKYRLTKLPDASDKWAEGTPKFLTVIYKFVKAGDAVSMCLPAFPWKSANKVYKVLGTLPDKAEEISLARLNTMCTEIGEVYKPGAKLLIVSDGLVYNGNSPCTIQMLLTLTQTFSSRPPYCAGKRCLGLRRGASYHGLEKISTHLVFPTPGHGCSATTLQTG